MNKITTDIISTTGINISKYDILPSKVFVNGIEITDEESWNKVISSIDKKDKEIERLNNVINELVLNCYNSDMSYCEFESIWQIAFNEKYNPDKLKELKENNNE